MATEFITSHEFDLASTIIEQHSSIINSVWDCLADHLGEYHPDDTPLFAIKFAATQTRWEDARELFEAYQFMANIARAVADMTETELPI